MELGWFVQLAYSAAAMYMPSTCSAQIEYQCVIHLSANELICTHLMYIQTSILSSVHDVMITKCLLNYACGIKKIVARCRVSD